MQAKVAAKITPASIQTPIVQVVGTAISTFKSDLTKMKKRVETAKLIKVGNKNW